MFPLEALFEVFLFGILVLNLPINVNYFVIYANASAYPMPIQSPQGPIINDPKLKAEVVFRGVNFPTSMAFLGPNDILLLQKNNGTVQRIVNGKIFSKPLLGVNVATQTERGLLGIAVTNIRNNNNTGNNSTNIRPTSYVFLYYTQSGGGKTGDDTSGNIEPECNCLYRYELLNNTLANPKLLLSLPAIPGPYHNGGKLIVGPDDNVYFTIGDLFRHRTKAQNLRDGKDPDGTGGILRMTQDGIPVGKGIIGDKFPLNLYYAYGIRNSFGIAFDPVTGKLWETENGPEYGDEINLVEPGFNSGWVQIQGIWTINGNKGPVVAMPHYLVDFGGKGKYRSPEFTWFHPVGATGLTFLNSTKLGQQYKNDMFVGDFNNGNLYHFKLNKQRNGLLLNSVIAGKVAYSSDIEPTNWFDVFINCDHIFTCTINSTNGWHGNKTSFQLSTNTTNKNTWSSIYGNEINVSPAEQYEFITHMKLNEFAAQSHVALEAYNNKTKQWHQISQCPTGTNGPLEWHEYSCEITIPANTTKIRPILNAGWSSQPGKQAVTLFDAIYLKETNKCLNKICTSITSAVNNNIISNPNFVNGVIFGHGFGHITDVKLGPDGYLYVLSLHTNSTFYPQQEFPYDSAVKETIYRIVPN